MKRWIVPTIAAGALLTGYATAQVVSPLVLPVPAAPDTSQFASKADLSNAVAAATPSDCPAPLSDGLTATAGVQPRCMPRQDAQRATVVQASTVMTAADGSFIGTWPVPFATAPTARSATVEIASGTSAPFVCSFIAGSVTTTGFTGRCFQLVSTTLPATVTALVGLTINPVANAAGNLTVRVTGRQ